MQLDHAKISNPDSKLRSRVIQSDSNIEKLKHITLNSRHTQRTFNFIFVIYKDQSASHSSFQECKYERGEY